MAGSVPLDASPWQRTPNPPSFVMPPDEPALPITPLRHRLSAIDSPMSALSPLTPLLMERSKGSASPYVPTSPASDSDDSQVFPLSQMEGRRQLPGQANHRPLEFPVWNEMQLLSAHDGPVWVLRFSRDGWLLCTSGRDCVVRVWTVQSEDSIDSTTTESSPSDYFSPKPLCEFVGHEADVVDADWSTSCLLITCSLDKSVRLWHPQVEQCLAVFKHPDYITSVAFHPNDETLFLTGGMDENLRLWNVQKKAMERMVHVSEIITAVGFTDDGARCMAGTLRGRVHFFTSEKLQGLTQLEPGGSKKWLGSGAAGLKVVSIEAGNGMVLVTTADRPRVFRLNDFSLKCQYKGSNNESAQQRASFSHDGEYIVCGSDEKGGRVVLWRRDIDERVAVKNRKQLKNTACEWFERRVTSAVFGLLGYRGVPKLGKDGMIIVAAGYEGEIVVFRSGFAGEK